MHFYIATRYIATPLVTADVKQVHLNVSQQYNNYPTAQVMSLQPSNMLTRN